MGSILDDMEAQLIETGDGEVGGEGADGCGGVGDAAFRVFGEVGFQFGGGDAGTGEADPGEFLEEGGPVIGTAGTAGEAIIDKMDGGVEEIAGVAVFQLVGEAEDQIGGEAVEESGLCLEDCCAMGFAEAAGPTPVEAVAVMYFLIVGMAKEGKIGAEAKELEATGIVEGAGVDLHGVGEAAGVFADVDKQMIEIARDEVVDVFLVEGLARQIASVAGEDKIPAPEAEENGGRGRVKIGGKVVGAVLQDVELGYRGQERPGKGGWIACRGERDQNKQKKERKGKAGHVGERLR